MPIVVEPYGPNWMSAVHDFNQRLSEGAVSADFRFPEGDASTWPCKEPRCPFEERFVAVDAGMVRGGYILKHQDFMIRGVVRSIAQYRLPISEGIINRRHVGVGPRLLRHALHVQPLLFVLGMGGVENALARMLAAVGWRLWTVPFYFRACQPSAVVRTLVAQRAV